MSDTPITDAATYISDMTATDKVVRAEFARKLERQRDEANEASKIIQEREAELVAKFCFQRDLAKEREIEIAWLQSMLKALSEARSR